MNAKSARPPSSSLEHSRSPWRNGGVPRLSEMVDGSFYQLGDWVRAAEIAAR
jgi:hypothetical protein